MNQILAAKFKNVPKSRRLGFSEKIKHNRDFSPSGAAKGDNALKRENMQQIFSFKTNDLKKFFGHIDGVKDGQMNRQMWNLKYYFI